MAVSYKAPTFAPAFGNEAVLIERLRDCEWDTSGWFSGEFPGLPFLRGTSHGERPPETPSEKFSKKNFEKIWKIIEKVLTFAAAFPMKRKRDRKRSLMDLHEQWSSTRAKYPERVLRVNEPSMTYGIGIWYSGNPGRANEVPQGTSKDTFTMESLILAQDER